MRKAICFWTVVLLVSVGARSPATENTSSSQKKSIAYLGIGYLEDLPIPPHHLKAIELNIRKNLELPRFEYIEISPEKHLTIDQFLEAYRTLVHLNAHVDFFRLNLSDPQKPAYTLEASIIPGAPTSLREQLTIIADGHRQLDELLARCAHSLGRSGSVT